MSQKIYYIPSAIDSHAAVKRGANKNQKFLFMYSYILNYSSSLQLNLEKKYFKKKVDLFDDVHS